MHKFVAIAGLVGLGLAGAWSLRPGAQEGDKARDAEAARLLEDRSQPWWNNHKPPKVKGPSEYRMAPNDDLGAREDPPIYTAQMPVEVAAWIHAGGRPSAGHPLGGRPLVLLDIRRRSQFAAERIAGSLNVPAAELAQSLENGELSRMDKQAVVVLFGSRWPHYEVVSRVKGAKAFDALYAMEGLEAWKKKGNAVERDEKLAQFLKVLEAEKPPTPPKPPDPEPMAGLNARALKALLDSGVDLLCLFVGDRKTYEDGHVPGAIHVPLHELDKWIADVDRSKPVVLICGCCQGERGGPSELGVRQLEKLGFKRALHLDGHMFAWKTAGLPIQTEDPPPKK